jgi:hypothetical protein
VTDALSSVATLAVLANDHYREGLLAVLGAGSGVGGLVTAPPCNRVRVPPTLPRRVSAMTDGNGCCFS